MMLFLFGCMTLDGFFFAGTPVDEYSLSSEVIPAENLEEVSFEGADGNTLWGVWAHQPTAGAPVLFYLHGNSGNIDLNFERVEYYWSWGFETFTMDYRGFGKSEGESDYAGVIADAGSAIGYVEDTTGLPSTEWFYVGHSLGGFAAVHNVSKHPPKALVTESMFASAKHLSDQGLGLDLPSGWFFVDPFDNVAAVQEFSVPYLIIHGEVDDFINISNGEEVAAAANDPKLFWKVHGGGHSDIPTVDPEGYQQHILCWTLQNNDCPAEQKPEAP